MRMSALFFSLGMVLATGVNATEPTRCSTPDPSQASVIQLLKRSKVNAHTLNPPGVIKIVWHDIRASNGDGAVSDETLVKQRNMLNQAMRANGIPITFEIFRMPREVIDDKFFATCRDNLALIRQQSFQPENYINVFSCGDNSSLGWAYQPYGDRFDEKDTANRVYVNYRTLPGSNWPGYDLGATLVHEIGHYLGLVHVFYPNPEEGTHHICERGGNPVTGGGNPGYWGDYIADTPAQKEATHGCPAQAPSSCPGAVDSIHNFMDYSFDSCLAEFTPDQIKFMYFVSATARPILWSGGTAASKKTSDNPVLIKVK